MTNPFQSGQQTPITSAPLPGQNLNAPSAPSSFPTIDLEGVESSNLVDPGTYAMYLFKIEGGQTKAGDEKIVWHFKIFNHPKFNNRVLALHVALTPSNLFRMKQVQEALGQQGRHFTPSESMYGTIVMGRVSVQEYENQKRSSLDGVFAPPTSVAPVGAKYTPTDPGVPS